MNQAENGEVNVELLARERRQGHLQALVELGAINVAAINALLIGFRLVSRNIFEKIFAEFKATMPFITELAWSPGFLGLLFFVFALTIGKEFFLRSVVARLASTVFFGMIVLALAAIYVVAVFLPLFELIDKLS